MRAIDTISIGEVLLRLLVYLLLLLLLKLAHILLLLDVQQELARLLELGICVRYALFFHLFEPL